MSRGVVVSVSLYDRGRRSRSLPERLAIRAPGLYYRVVDLTMGLPRRSRVRRALLRMGASVGFAAYNRRDYEIALLPFHAQVEARQAEASGVPIGTDLERSWQGTGGFLRLWDEWDKAWADARLQPKQLLDLGDSVLILATYVARGRRSGAEVRQPAAQLHTFRDGKVVGWEQWWGWDEALEAVGLRE